MLDVNSPENSNEVLSLDKSNLEFDNDKNVFSNPSFSHMDISYENDIKSFSSNINIPAAKKRTSEYVNRIVSISPYKKDEMGRLMNSFSPHSTLRQKTMNKSPANFNFASNDSSIAKRFNPNKKRLRSPKARRAKLNKVISDFVQSKQSAKRNARENFSLNKQRLLSPTFRIKNQRINAKVRQINSPNQQRIENLEMKVKSKAESLFL